MRRRWHTCIGNKTERRDQVVAMDWGFLESGTFWAFVWMFYMFWSTTKIYDKQIASLQKQIEHLNEKINNVGGYRDH